MKLNLPICAASKCTSGSLWRFAAAVGFRSWPPLRHVRRQQNILPSVTRVCKLFVFVSAWISSAALCVSFVFFACAFSCFCSQTAVLLCNPGMRRPHLLTSTVSVFNFSTFFPQMAPLGIEDIEYSNSVFYSFDAFVARERERERSTKQHTVI